MRAFGLSWTEAKSLTLWQLHAMEEDYRDRQKMEETRQRLQ